MRRLLSPSFLYDLLASVPFVAIFALVPCSLYLHADDDWNFAPQLLLKLAAAGVLLWLVTAVLLRLLALRFARPAVWLSIGLFCLGGWLVLAHVYAPIPIGPLDGGDLVSAEPLRASLLELAFLVAMVAAGIWLGRGRGLIVAGALSAALWLVGIGYLAAALWPSAEAAAAKRTAASDPATPPRTDLATSGNVYQIVLDTLHTETFLKVVEEHGWQAEFDGFDLFTNNLANYLVTVNSRASYLTGRRFEGGDLRDFRASWRSRGLLQRLSDQGYELTMYGPFANWDNELTDHFVDNATIYERVTGLAGSGFLDFISIWLASLAPTALTNEAIAGASVVRDPIFRLVVLAGDPVTSEAPFPLSVPGGFDAYASTLAMAQLRADEPERAPAGNYVYLHALIPHGPYVLDGHCRYVGRPGQRSKKPSVMHAYRQQAECALREVIAFLDRLRELGRYDTATIVLHADTGHWMGKSGSTSLAGIDDQSLIARVRALLAIKPPGAHGPLRLVDTPTQLVDIHPTVLDLLDLGPPEADLHGRSVYGPAIQEPREARFATDPDRRYGLDLIELRLDDPSDPEHSTLTVLGPLTNAESP